MKLAIDKPTIVLDLETTGLSVTEDRIIQIAMLKMNPDGTEELKTRYINPERTIPPMVVKLTGINDDMVKNEPPFSKIAKGMLAFIGDSDIITFNGNRFDIPFLMESFSREGLELDMTNRRYVDVKRIFHRMEPRDLKSAYRMFMGKPLEHAHDAGADVKATIDVLEAMIEAYKGKICINKDDTIVEDPIKNDMNSLFEFTKNFDEIDMMGTLRYNDEGVAVFNFGKYQGQSVTECLTKDTEYYNWIMFKGKFTVETRRSIERIMASHRQKLLQNEGATS